MKIDPNLTIGGVVPQKTAKPLGKQGAFEDMLSGIEQKTIPETIPAMPSTAVSTISPMTIKGLGMGEQAIDLLDGYASALADPDVTLKSIQPIVNELAGLKEGLDKTVGALSDDDPLKGILKDVGATLESEVLRFSRGDLLM
ncbi:MAG: hypothetical protein ABFD81_12930 [Syntrophaceae bacterium]